MKASPDNGPRSQSHVMCSASDRREGKLPLVVLPRSSEPGVDPLGPALRACSDRYLTRAGSILLRGFGIRDERALRELVSVFADPTRSYKLGRGRALAGGDADAASLRNERAYGPECPSRLWLCCTDLGQARAVAAIADCREVYRRVCPSIRRRWTERGLLLVRSYGTEVGLPWGKAFETADGSCVERHCVERHCLSLGIRWEWRNDDGLRLSKVCTAVAVHPLTGESVWFNDAHRCTAPFSEDERGSAPTSIEPACEVRHADGSRIDPTDLRHVRAAFEASTVVFDWEPGDVLMLDNLLTAHAPNLLGGDVELTIAAEYAGGVASAQPDPLRF
jgi:hypothetical protein